MAGEIEQLIERIAEQAATAVAEKVAAAQAAAMERLADVAVIAELLDVSTDQVYALIHSKLITAFKVGKYWKLRPSQVLAELRIPGRNEAGSKGKSQTIS